MCDACGPVRGGGLRLRGALLARHRGTHCGGGGGGGLRVRTVRWRRLLVVVVVFASGSAARTGGTRRAAAPALLRQLRTGCGAGLAVAGAVERGSRAGAWGRAKGGLARSCVVRAVLASAAFRGPLPSLHKPLQFFKFFSAWGFLGLVAYVAFSVGRARKVRRWVCVPLTGCRDRPGVRRRVACRARSATGRERVGAAPPRLATLFATRSAIR